MSTTEDKKLDFPLGTWVWVQKKGRWPEVALYTNYNGAIGYHLAGEVKVYQKEDFARIWETPLEDPDLAHLREALKKQSLDQLSSQDQKNVRRLACYGCVVEGCMSYKQVEGCFRSKYMAGAEPKKRGKAKRG